MKRAAIASLLTLALAGCTSQAHSSSEPTPSPSHRGGINVIDVKVGPRTIPCITWTDATGAAISCDWITP